MADLSPNKLSFPTLATNMHVDIAKKMSYSGRLLVDYQANVGKQSEQSVGQEILSLNKSLIKNFKITH